MIDPPFYRPEDLGSVLDFVLKKRRRVILEKKFGVLAGILTKILRGSKTGVLQCLRAAKRR